MDAVSPDHAALGRAVRVLRERRGLSQEGLAEAAGLHRTYVGGIERGEQNPTLSSLVQLANALDVKLSDLLAGYESFVRSMVSGRQPVRGPRRAGLGDR